MNGSPDIVLFGWVAVIVLIGLIVLFGSWFTVEQQEVAIVQRLGKFLRIARAGLNFKVPLIDQVVANVNLRVQQLTVKVETKTRDNVFVHVTVAVQFSVFPDKVYQALLQPHRRDAADHRLRLRRGARARAESRPRRRLPQEG